MITLYKFGYGPTLGLPDLSPFVVKAEMLLKLAGLPYETNTKGFHKAPKGKLPYINDAGTIVADSTFIRWHIEQRYGIDFDKGLSSEQRAVAWSVEKLLEDHLYWAMLDTRWNDDANFEKGSARFFDSVPWPLRGIVKSMVRRKFRAGLLAHGMGRHSSQERVALANKGIESIAAILADKPYLMGAQPCGADATLFAFASSMLCPRFDSPIRRAAETHPNLVAYADRMIRQHFPELAGR